MSKEEINEEFSDYLIKPEHISGAMEKLFVKRCVTEARRYIKRTYGDNVPEFDTILFDYNSIFVKSDESTVSLSNFYLIRTLKEVMRNPQVVLDVYESMKDSEEFWKRDPNHSYKYTSNIESNFRQAAYDVLHNFTDCTGKKFEKEKLLSLADKEKEKFFGFLKSEFGTLYKSFSNVLTENYIKGIISTVEKLRSLGILDSLLEKNNSDRQLMGLDVLKFEMSGRNEKDKYCIEDLMEEETLKKLPPEKLALMHGFYSNRLKKVTDMLGTGLFICGKIPEGLNIKHENFSVEEAVRVYANYSTVNGIYLSALPKIYDDLKKYTVEGMYDGRKYVVASKEKIYEVFFEKFETEYFEYSKERNVLSVDFDNFLATQVIDYHQKDFSLEMLLLIATENFGTVNWGYIPEEVDGRNSIERNRKNILLGFDIPGFNMPVRLHMPIEKVRTFYDNFDNDYMIPNYMGDKDMEVWEKNMGTSVLVPLSPKHRKNIIAAVKKMKPGDKFYNFAKHIECMQYDNNLFRLQKWKDPNGRKGARTYTDIRTGKTVAPMLGRR